VLAIYSNEDEYVRLNRFHNKTLCEQIQLRRPVETCCYIIVLARCSLLCPLSLLRLLSSDFSPGSEFTFDVI